MSRPMELHEKENKMHRVLIPALLLALSLIAPCSAETEAAPKSVKEQEMLSLPVRVTDADGKPVEGAVIIPWALRCSQGHGGWQADGFGGSEPPKLTTDASGVADVPYPRFAIADEEVVTTEVTLSIDHPEFALVPSKYINVLPQAPPRVDLTLQSGGSVILRPVEMEAGRGTDGLYAVWSDGRSWRKDYAPTITDEGDLRLPIMPLGQKMARIARMDGDEVLSLSRRIEFEVKPGEPEVKQALMPPPRTIVGKLSDNVPRPVMNGRVKAQSLPLADDNRGSECQWYGWAPVDPDGTFVIQAWPEDDDIQLIALCDGYVAAWGAPPEGEEEARRGLRRPQVYSKAELDESGGEVVIEMEPMAACEVTTVDAQGKPVKGVRVSSYPNVQWWRGGSQIYCWPLTSSQRMFRHRDYRKAADETFPQPFVTTTDEQGRGKLELPAGGESFNVEHPDLELPVADGRREINVVLKEGETKQVELKLQPKGTDLLGEQ